MEPRFLMIPLASTLPAAPLRCWRRQHSLKFSWCSPALSPSVERTPPRHLQHPHTITLCRQESNCLAVYLTRGWTLCRGQPRWGHSRRPCSAEEQWLFSLSTTRAALELPLHEASPSVVLSVASQSVLLSRGRVQGRVRFCYVSTMVLKMERI